MCENYFTVEEDNTHKNIKISNLTHKTYFHVYFTLKQNNLFQKSIFFNFNKKTHVKFKDESNSKIRK